MILGTAGHIDHGKTALVRALTGVDTDRLPEEQRRGITIELGFAPLRLDGGDVIGVVDVPGHDAFVRTMLAGATGVDLALLVIAADEGVMPQTREHLAILTLLGVRGGIVVLTKCDLVDADWIALVESDVRELITGTPLAGAAVVRCSAVRGTGLTELRSEISRAALAVPARNADDLFRMPIDRVFSVRGTGTVVTGTQWSGSLAVDDAVRLFPGDRGARVRALESHGTAVARTSPGTRVAIALGGLDRADVARGAVLVCDGDPWRASTLLRADVALLPGTPMLSARASVRLHLGTFDVGARVAVRAHGLSAEPDAPVLCARLSLDQPIVARAGDRFVLRMPSRNATIGGGVVTDPYPPSRRAKPWPLVNADHVRRLEWVVAEQGGDGFPRSEIVVRIGVTPGEVAALEGRAHAVAHVVALGDRLFATTVRDDAAARLLALVTAWHRAHPLEPGLSTQHAREQLRVHPALFDAARAQLAATRRVDTRESVLAAVGWAGAETSAADRLRLEQILGRLREAGAEPPSVGELELTIGPATVPLLKVLARDGRVVAVGGDRFYALECLNDLRTKVRMSLAGGATKTASQLKDSLGLTRKYLIPLLEFFDREGLTVRSGDLRSLRNPG